MKGKDINERLWFYCWKINHRRCIFLSDCSGSSKKGRSYMTFINFEKHKGSKEYNLMDFVIVNRREY